MEIQVASLHVKHFCFVVFIIPGLYSAVRGLSLSNRSRSVSSFAFLNNSKTLDVFSFMMQWKWGDPLV